MALIFMPIKWQWIVVYKPYRCFGSRIESNLSKPTKVHGKMEQNGGFLTEFWSTSNPDKENFIKRNRIVAGISEATIVIESAERGGSLVTANLANDYNRDVFAVPGRTTDKYSQGCNNLIKTQRANLLTSAADLVYILNWELQRESQKAIQNNCCNLN